MPFGGKINKRRSSSVVLAGTLLGSAICNAASQNVSAAGGNTQLALQDVAASGTKALNNQSTLSGVVSRIFGYVIVVGIAIVAIAYLYNKNKSLNKTAKELQKSLNEKNKRLNDLDSENTSLQENLNKNLKKNEELQKVLDRNRLDLDKLKDDNAALKKENEDMKSTLSKNKREEKVELTAEKNINFNIKKEVKNGYNDGNISRNEEEIKEKFEGLKEKTFCVTKKDVLSLPFRSGEKEKMEEILKEFEDGEEFFLFVEESRCSSFDFVLINKKTNMDVLKDEKYYVVSLDYDRKILNLLSGKEDNTRGGVFESAFLIRGAHSYADLEKFREILLPSSEWYKDKIIEINKKELENITDIEGWKEMEKVKKNTSDKDTLFIMIDEICIQRYFVFHIVDEKGNKKSSLLTSKCATESAEKLGAFKKYFIKNAKTLKEKQDLNLVVNGDNNW